MAAIHPRLDASSSSYRCSYHAFLSFRGKDTRKSFTDHLYSALNMAGIHTFRDDDEIERGENIAEELQRAIQESQVSIIVFSKDYASSTWCLNELTRIMERRKTGGQMVMPVFYDVDPSHVRQQTGSFKQAFAKHEDRFKEDMEKVQEWRRALREVADLGGMVLGDRYEAQFIQDIVERIRNKLDNKALNVAVHVGIDDRVEGINMWLRDGSNDVSIAVIYGMGGIGKTTIAKAAYNQNFDRFEVSSFLTDIRANSANGLVCLQRKLLSDIQKGKAKKVYSEDEGVRKIKLAVCCKRVLIVLDDLNDLDQFKALIPEMRQSFHPRSKIIITARHQYSFQAHEVCPTLFKVQALNEYESLQLFSWHAFGQANPIEGYMELARPVVQHCEGLPLALQVLGSSLSRKSVDVWKSALQNLALITDGKIEKILRISYDSLQDREKSLFLQIACFFIGKENEFTITVLDNHDFSPRIGIQNLVHRCLVKINENNKLVMHQLLRDMAREIIRQESPEDPGKRTRVWQKDASDILRKLTGTKTIKGLMLNLPSKTMLSGSGTKRCHDEEYDGKFSRLRNLGFFSQKSINFPSKNSAPTPHEEDFKTEAFVRMHNLELMLFNNVRLRGGYEDFPKHLTWLAWRGFPFRSIPDNLSLENLVALDLRNSSLRHLWKGTRSLPRLKVLNLSHSYALMTIPDLSACPKLERLILKDCINLVEVGESIGDLEKLVFLNLKDCKNLLKLPARLGMLKSLEELILHGCSRLMLHPNKTATNQLHPSDMEKLSLSAKSWQSIWSLWSWISPRKNLESTSFSLASLPHCLGKLSLAFCNLLEIPGDISILTSLKHLDLRGNPLLSLPETMKDLIMLQTLLLKGSTKLQKLPMLPPWLNEVQAGYCGMVESKNFPNVFRSSKSNRLQCEKSIEVQSSFNIKPLISIDIEIMKDRGLFNLQYIGSPELEMFNYLTRTTRKGPLQGVYECGIFSIFLHGNKVPDWFTYRSLGNSVLSIIIPSHFNLKIRGLNACVLYARGANRDLEVAGGQHLLKVSNETKGHMWSYYPVTVGLPKENEGMLWLSHWQFEDDEMEAGEEIRISLDEQDNFLTKEFGIHLVYHEHESKGKDKGVGSNRKDIIPQETSPSSQNVVAGNVSMSRPKYQLWTGKYFEHNHMDRTRQAHLDFSYEPEGSFHSLFKEEDVCP